jgi:hypothetical protein
MQGKGTRHSRLSIIKSRLEQAGIEWVIFAGAAAACYGSNRRITDVDILIGVGDLEKVKDASKGVDVEGFDIGCGAEIKTDQGTCLFFLDDEMIERANRKKLFGVDVPVMSAEDNIVLKAILQRGAERGKHDVEDIKFMLAHGKVDLKYLERRIRKCQAEKRVKPLLESMMPTK